MKNRTANNVVLALIIGAILFGIAQGIPDAIEALSAILGLS
jgi:hypothetical protein